jgi:hypothetical protein
MKWLYDEAPKNGRETSVSTDPSITHFRRWRQSWKPPAAITASAKALVTWFEETIATAAEIIKVVFMFIMTGVIYLFNVYVFRFAAPEADDL